MCSILPVSETDAALVGKNGPKCAECGLGPADGGLSKANFLELRLAAVQLRRIHLPRTRLNNGKKKAGPPFLGGGMRWPARPLNGIVIQASKLGEHSFHAVTRYSAVCAAHPQGPRTSENSVKEKFAPAGESAWPHPDRARSRRRSRGAPVAIVFLMYGLVWCT